MKDKKDLFEASIKKGRFPTSLFGIYLGIVLLMSGIHVGVIVLMNRMGLNEVIQCIIPIVYWSIVAAGLTIFTRKKVKETYEEPMQQLAQATMRVANGDFSVYVPTLHTKDKLDYLDFMIMDFNKMVEELGSIETLKTDFVSNVSHEMKTPIAVIKNYAELLKMENISEEQRYEYIVQIEQAARKMSSLISNILRLNKLENQTILPEKKEYNVCRQVLDSILQFEQMWDEKEIELDIDMEVVLKVYADESLMEVVWNNLLSNAIKFTEPGGTVTVTHEFDDEHVKISVADTGCGMSSGSIKHIFDKFYQGDASHAKEGNGLGLAMVKRIVELMDGDIQVVSKQGKGSTFTVVLPKKKPGKGEGE